MGERPGGLDSRATIVRQGRVPQGILLVDDDFRVRDLWVKALTSAGYAAVGAEDGMVALERIRDLILLDLRMPRSTGLGQRGRFST